MSNWLTRIFAKVTGHQPEKDAPTLPPSVNNNVRTGSSGSRAPVRRKKVSNGHSPRGYSNGSTDSGFFPGYVAGTHDSGGFDGGGSDCGRGGDCGGGGD